MSYYERAERLRDILKAAVGEGRAITAQLDSEEKIALVHEAWKSFAFDDGCDEKDFEVGWSYLQVCGDRLPGGAQPNEEQLDVVYPRELAGEERWFRLRLVAGNDGKRRSIMVQTNVNPTAPGRPQVA